ncbi:MAG: hypothetical protein ABJ004_00155 [Cyclobacteriaceae bacterium]
MKYSLFSAFLLMVVCTYAQDLPTHHTDSTGNLYWRKSTPVYLFISDSPDGEKERLKSKVTEKYADPFYLDTEGVNYIRSKHAVDPETKQIIPNLEIMFEVYADGIAPVSTISYKNVSKYKSPEHLYYKDGMTVELTSKDEMSGVRTLSYKINGSGFKDYQQPIEFSTRGDYELSVYAIDNVGNVEETQTVSFIIDDQDPVSKINVNGITEAGVVSNGSKMYLLAYDSLSGIKTLKYRFDDLSEKVYNGKELPFTELEEGDHTVYFHSEDRVGNVEEEQSFSFFLDKSAPLMVADVLGDRFIVNDEIYFSGRTKLKLTAVDNKVGVKEIMFSVDEEEFKKYENPFYLPSVSGVHLIRYYSVDNLNNSTADSKKSHYLGQGGFEEFKHNVNKFYVDLTGPVISHKVENYSFVREDTLYLGPYSKIRLTGTDPESGLQNITYSVNNEVGENAYDEPFTLSKEGFTTLSYYGYDNVNNRNIADFKFYLDSTDPEVFIQFNTGATRERNGLKEYPITAGIFLSATDKTSGISKMYYTLGNEPERSYAGLITNIKKGKHKLIVRAIDFLNNEKVEEIEFYIK